MKVQTLGQLARVLQNTLSTQKLMSGVCVDTRLLNPGEVFFALKGAQTDGHQFLSIAAEKGAAAAVVHHDYTGSNFNLPLIRVHDSLHALQTVAAELIKVRKSKIIAVTGSVGKTTTKDFITTLLSHKFTVAGTPGNSNSKIGVPLAIINHFQGDEDIVVIEMGMTHAGDITDLVQIAPPDVAVITTVGLVHACNFNGLPEIALAKAEIFSHAKTLLGLYDFAIGNIASLGAIGTCRKLSFSVGFRQADYFLEVGSEGLEITTPSNEKEVVGSLLVPGKHNQHNFLVAVACAHHFGMSWEEIRKAMTTLTLPEKRLQFVLKNGILFVNDSYNASAISVKAALTSLPEVTKKSGRKIAVIGEMLELGKYSEQCHKEVGEEALKHVDLMFCLGSACKPIKESWEIVHKPVLLFNDREALIRQLRVQLREGDVVLLKGSRANQLWKVLEEI